MVASGTSMNSTHIEVMVNQTINCAPVHILFDYFNVKDVHELQLVVHSVPVLLVVLVGLAKTRFV